MARSYVSPMRAEKRSATRAAIRDAAAVLFVEHGYAATTIVAIARRAGVSAQSVYDVYGTKRDLLRAVTHETVVGDAATMLDSEWARSIAREPDQRRRWDLMRAGAGRVLETALPLTTVVRQAAALDSEIADLWLEMESNRRRDVEGLVALLEEAGPLRLSAREAVDVVWALSRASDLFSALHVDQGWSAAAASDLVAEAIARAILPDPG